MLREVPGRARTPEEVLRTALEAVAVRAAGELRRTVEVEDVRLVAAVAALRVPVPPATRRTAEPPREALLRVLTLAGREGEALLLIWEATVPIPSPRRIGTVLLRAPQ